MTLLIIAGVLVLAVYFGRFVAGVLTPEATKRDDIEWLARILASEQETPADGEWAVIASVALNRARMKPGHSMRDIANGIPGYPWNDSQAARKRREQAHTFKCFPEALHFAQTFLRQGRTVAKSTGFVHAGRSSEIPGWLTPIDGSVPTGGKLLVYGGR